MMQPLGLDLDCGALDAPKNDFSGSKPLTLRPYQVEVIKGVRQAMAGGIKRVILQAACGAGKTECGAEIIKGAIAKGKRVAFLANRIHLVSQTAKRLAKSGIECGVIQGANTFEPWQPILVCSIQTVAKRGLPDVDLIIIDEAHSAAGTKSYRDIMKGKPCIGLTATPYSKGLGKHYDDLGGKLFEKVVSAISINELIEQGYLVSAEVWAPGEPDLASVKVVAGEYEAKSLGEAVDKPSLIGDIVTHWLRLANGESTVVFATNISHSKHICEQFKSIGVTAEHLDCYTSDADRKAILERVALGETKVTCNVGILCEGWDFPSCKVLILARPTKSLIRYLQMAGRVLRPFPGKEKALIIDHAGVVKRLGFPWDDFSQELDDGKPKDGASKKEKEEKAPLPKVCPKCHIVNPPKTLICPGCGLELKKKSEVETADGTLVQLTGKKRKPKVVQLAELGKQEIYSQLMDHAQSHGYSDGWIAHKYRAIFDVWPKGLDRVPKPETWELANWIRHETIKWAKSKRNAS